LDRNHNLKYEQAGRIQNEDEAKRIDFLLQGELLIKEIEHRRFFSDLKNVNQICDFIESIK
jgi:hypothetical protein